MKCPKCRGQLLNNGSEILHEASTCDFKIGMTKFIEIVNNLYKPKSRREEIDNLSELNNL